MGASGILSGEDILFYRQFSCDLRDVFALEAGDGQLIFAGTPIALCAGERRGAHKVTRR